MEITKLEKSFSTMSAHYMMHLQFRMMSWSLSLTHFPAINRWLLTVAPTIQPLEQDDLVVIGWMIVKLMNLTVPLTLSHPHWSFLLHLHLLTTSLSASLVCGTFSSKVSSMMNSWK